MRFVALIGDAGSGKTTLMTALLKTDADRGVKIISNYHLIGIPHTVMPFTELAKMPESITGATIGMDELGKGADSYEFFTTQSRKLTTLVAESRKRHCTVYFTVQRFNLIAYRLRQQVSGFILMRDLDAETRHCRCYPRIDDLAKCKCGVPYLCAGEYEAVFVNDSFKTVNRQTFYGKPFQKYFDTDEIIW